MSAHPDCVPTYASERNQETFYDETGIGGTICQNIDPSFLTAEEREKMAELRRKHGISEPDRVPEAQPRCDSPVLEEVAVVTVPEEVWQGYDPEALVKVTNLIELEQINTEIGRESTALRINNRELSRYIEKLKLENKSIQEFYVGQHKADMAAKDANIEKQEMAKKRAQEKLRAERKSNELFAAQNFKSMSDDHLQHLFQMISSEMRSRGMHVVPMESSSGNMCSIQTLTPTSQLSTSTTPDVVVIQKRPQYSIDAILNQPDKLTIFDDNAHQGTSQELQMPAVGTQESSLQALSRLQFMVANPAGPNVVPTEPPMSRKRGPQKPRAPRKPRAIETKPRATRRSKESRTEFQSKMARNQSFTAVELTHEENAKKFLQFHGIKL